MEQTFSIKYNSDVAYNIGDYLYGIVADETVHLTSMCPICDDMKTVEIKGKKFSCPYCCGNERKNRTSITLINYAVRKFKINGINCEISDEILSADDKPKMKISMFSKKKAPTYSGFDFERRVFAPKQIITVSGFKTYEEVYEKCNEIYNHNRTSFCEINTEETMKKAVYSDYKTAKIVADHLNELEKARLMQFNEDNKCNHTYEFVCKHDKPVSKRK